VGNPLDTGYSGIVDEDVYVGAARAVLESGRVDMLAVQGELPQELPAESRVRRLRRIDALAAEFPEVPVAVLGYTAPAMGAAAREVRRSLRHLAFPADADAYLRTMGRVLAAAPPRGAARATRRPSRPSRVAGAAAALLRDARAPRRGALDEVESKALLALYGLAAPAERVVHSAAEALAAARAIGYPVVVKIVSADVPHKAAIGGVVTGVGDDDALLAAVAAVEADTRRRRPDARLAGVLVAAAVEDRVEVAIGSHRDAEVGPVVMFGAGGWAVEAGADRAVHAAPLRRGEAVAMVRSTRVGRAATRRDPARLDAYAAALVALGRLAADLDGLVAAVDVNPLAVGPGGALALDALVEPAGAGLGASAVLGYKL
jgi:acetyltransferase